MGKASIFNIAKAAGVSTATVSRALSGKKDVSERTRQRIIQLAEELNYQPSRLAKRLSASELSIAVFLSGQQFEEYTMDQLRGALDAERDLADYKVHIRPYLIKPIGSGVFSMEALPQAFRDILSSGVDAVINFPATYEHLPIPSAQTLWTPSDTPHVFSYAYDTYTAGKMACELLWNALGDNAKVCIFTSDKDSPPHGRGIQGFKDALKRYPLHLAAIYENHDDREMAYYAADAALRRFPGLQGIFVGSANSKMVCQRISECERPENICMVTSDIYAGLTEYIERRIVRATIVQSQYQQMYKTVHELAMYLITRRPPGQPALLMAPQIVIRSNMEGYLTRLTDSEIEKYKARLIYMDP